MIDPTDLSAVYKMKEGILHKLDNSQLMSYFDDKKEFVTFYNDVYERGKKNRDCSWKAHLSILPEDLDRAWKIIYPILNEAASTLPVKFKIVNRTINTISFEKGLDYLKETSLVTEEHIKNFNSIKRLEFGMQVTLYMLPGQEKVNQELLEKIESALVQEGIRPGKQDPMERSLGLYTSVRHPGKSYNDAVDVIYYNLSGEADPFTDLENLPSDYIYPPLKALQEYLPKHIDSLKKPKNSTGDHNKALKADFATFLQNESTNFFKQDKLNQMKHLVGFQEIIIKKQEEVGKDIHNDNHWITISLHLLMFISGLGTLPALYSIGEKLFTGRYAFFDFTPTAHSMLGSKQFNETLGLRPMTCTYIEDVDSGEHLPIKHAPDHKS